MKGLFLGGIVGGIGGIAIGMVLGAALFAGLGYMQSGGINVCYDQNHQLIADTLQVYDTTVGLGLQAKFVLMAPADFYPYAPMNVFTPRETYTQSLWIWVADNDIDVTMTIWGPGDDGKTFAIEFGKHAYNGIEIKGFGQQAVWQRGSTEGYAAFTAVITS